MDIVKPQPKPSDVQDPVIVEAGTLRMPADHYLDVRSAKPELPGFLRTLEAAQQVRYLPGVRLIVIGPSTTTAALTPDEMARLTAPGVWVLPAPLPF